MNDRREAKRQCCERTRDRLILREDELRPATILELIDCLRDLPLHSADKRMARLEQVYRDFTGREPPTHG